MTRLTFLFIVPLLAYPPEVKTLFPPRKTSLSRKIFNTELLKYYNKGSASPNIASWLICAQASAIKENDIDFLYAVLLLNTDRLICDGKASKALTFLQKQAKQIPPVNHQGQACADKALGDCFMSFKHTRAARNKYADIIKQIKADGKDYHLSATDFTLEAPGPSDKAAKYRLIANQYLNLLLILSNDSTSPAIVGKVQLSLFKVDSASRYYLGAFSHYRQYQSVRDTVFNSGKIKQISALQAQFEKSLQANRTNQSINKMQIVGSTQMSMTQNMLLVLFLLLTTFFRSFTF